MALRGDFQGGSTNDPNLGNPMMGGGDIAIEKYMRWKFGFFGGAVVVSGTGLGVALHYLTAPEWAPASGVSVVFLMMFGVLMLVLDFPFPNMRLHPHISALRFHIYKFVLFMTRFMGRGVWYLFLATMVYSELFDANLNWGLAIILTLYLVILGGLAIAKGLQMTLKLERVKQAIVKQGRGAEHFLPTVQAGLSKEQFKTVAESVAPDHTFTIDEIEYVMSALAFSPESEGLVTRDEFDYWLRPGPPLMV